MSDKTAGVVEEEIEEDEEEDEKEEVCEDANENLGRRQVNEMPRWCGALSEADNCIVTGRVGRLVVRKRVSSKRWNVPWFGSARECAVEDRRSEGCGEGSVV